MHVLPGNTGLLMKEANGDGWGKKKNRRLNRYSRSESRV